MSPTASEPLRRPDLMGAEEVASELGVDPASGLPAVEATERLERFGPNELAPPRRDGRLRRLARQVAEPMSLLLLAAASVSGFGLGERIDAVAILAIVVLNVVIAMVQEGRAARALEALRSMETPMATVVRDGTPRQIPAREVVPGDVVRLGAGDRVPADLRLIRAAAVEVDESLLTGESVPVGKRPDAPGDEGAGVADRVQLAFAGTMVTRGAGDGIVAATGMATQLGRIAGRLGERPGRTPLQQDLRDLTLKLGGITIGIAVLVSGLILLRRGVSAQALQEAFLVGVALAVAAVPEGLAAVTTVGLALGVRRMADRGAIVRRLAAVETLGATSVVAIDKTGTLTENRMVVERVMTSDGEVVDPGSVPEAVRDALEEVAVLCNDASLDPVTGDPTEVALLELAGAERTRELRERAPRTDEIPFDAERKRMTTVHAAEGGYLICTKGAPESVLELCAEALGADGQPRPFDAGSLGRQASELAGAGLRTLALARRRSPERPGGEDVAERDLVCVGVVGLRDPVRPAAPSSVRESQDAGIRVVMVTGDHPGTAAAVGREVGLASEGEDVVTGRDLRASGLPADPLTVGVYARVDPDQKLELVRRLRELGHVVAVTGDGVNDAPALQEADIGVALGRSGTDVAREASDMIITDDNLATIVDAVREGRGIYDNIRKVVSYLVSCNLSEVMVVLVGLLAFTGLDVPLLPLQLLWMNVVTDGLPALALGVDPVDPGVMERPPRRKGAKLLGVGMIGSLGSRGAVLAASALAGLVVSRFVWGSPWDEARAVMFTVLVVSQLTYSFTMSGPDRGWGPRRLLGNPRLVGGVLLGVALQVAIVVWAPAQEVFGTVALSGREWGLVAALAGGSAVLLALVRRVASRPSEGAEGLD